MPVAPEPVVRAARMADAPEIARLTLQLGYEVSTIDIESRLARILAHTDQRFLIADVSGHAAGWLHAAVWEWVEAEASVVIGGLVVDSSVRRTGIGSLLIAHAERWAQERGCSMVRLWSSAGRLAAHRFYERLGYTNIKTQYSFVKSLDGRAADALEKLVPRL